MVQVRWTNIALNDLKSVYEYISIDSIQYAKIQIIKLKHRTKILKVQPLLGKIVPEFNKDTFRELIEGNYRIIYKVVNDSQVDILTIHHSSRDLRKKTF